MPANRGRANHCSVAVTCWLNVVIPSPAAERTPESLQSQWVYHAGAVVTSLIISLRRIEKALHLIDSPAGVMVANLDESTRVLRCEQQVTHQIRTRSHISSQAVYEVLEKIRHVFLVVLRQF